ncbi:hypothetical protein B0H66DRAFT_637403 [Apodospora peruviana]|uniref:DUF7580 domain-containing protein n=1 Tax=Apodospora peruviana TaxID=516989 RepID=A0AAE0MCK4_9PEZI|nr:hypothetical protein B0H66DRAFT_637403 [Apodospora peruviana]
MSGVELIVGTVLASVPIALEAYDRLGRIFEVFSVFRQYPREVLILEAKLGAQRTIFRNTAINLLTAITKDRLKVQHVVSQPSLQAVSQTLVLAPIYRDRLDALHESFVACRQTADQVESTLQVLFAQFDTFRTELGEKQDAASTSDWLKHVKTRFKLGLNKPQIGKAIEELRNFNQDFGLIADQICKMLEETLDFNAMGPRRSVKSLNALQHYHRIRLASKALYTTLQVRWLCESHHCHSFDIRVLDRVPDNVKGKSKPLAYRYVTCELSITHDGSSYDSKGPLRLEIEQACDEVDESQSYPQQVSVTSVDDAQQLTTTLEQSIGRFELTQRTAKPSMTSRIAKRFRGFRDSNSKGGDQQASPATTSAIPSTAPELHKITQSLAALQITSLHSNGHPTSSSAGSSAATDLSVASDFCKAFHLAMEGSLGRSLVGSWKDPTHAEWYCIPHEPQTEPGTSQSLSDIIRWVADDPIIRSLPRPVLIELAGNVAEGIMQFYSTPWLVSTNLGHNVRYYNRTDPSRAAVQLKGPYFMARVESTRAKAKATRPAISPGLASDSSIGGGAVDLAEARNKLLFNFGILLLEIGYGRPWQQLKQSVAKMPITATGQQKLSDYRAAEKLAQVLTNQMGPRYPKIVKQCLGCDFGLGETDLDNEDLQRRFQEDVVLGLRQMRDYMREMSLAAPSH